MKIVVGAYSLLSVLEGFKLPVTNRGERVVEDRELTIQYIYNLYYWMPNVGSLGSIATTLMEKHIGFSSAYLLDLCAVILCVFIVQVAKSRFVHPPVQGSKLPRAARCLWYAVRGGFKLNAALPQYQQETHGRVVRWDKELLQSCGMPCQLLKSGAIGWPIFWVCMGEGAQVSISQAGQVETHGIPNDLIKSANPIAYVIFGPIVQKQLYPFLQKRRIAFHAVDRIPLGFVIMSVAMAYSAVVQAFIYRTGPCYSHPLACGASDSGQVPNRTHVLWQLPHLHHHCTSGSVLLAHGL
ncbi:Oligopeptide transporter [Penicillium roqueforti FM164]|uniref:Oligopeptide transporter n=1 Tax=Penicillium roqueforti (strain FM164) TaxID=1365484 RepID=W6QTG9_PENRF|nr:Oligopeptide transporter [Penicillium roqueforti FM164]